MGQRYRSIEDQKLGDGLARNQQNFAESGGLEPKVKSLSRN